MTSAVAQSSDAEPWFVRLATLAELNAEELQLLAQSASWSRSIAPHREMRLDRPRSAQNILQSGWAAKIWSFTDGRRQIVNVLLPGDLIGNAADSFAGGNVSFLAMTNVTWCPAPQPLAGREGQGLGKAYAASEALERSYLYRQIARLGRLSARERLIDWLVELHERLDVAGQTNGGAFAFPLTQEIIGDTLGLTSVHVNRTIQGLRGEGLVEIGAGKAKLLQVDRLQYLADRVGRAEQ